MSEFAAVPESALAQLDAAMASDGISEGSQPALSAPAPDGFDPANEGLPSGETQQPSVATPAEQAPTPVAPEQPAAQEDSFTERFDPNSLPPELVPAYKAMQADYTRKRQADAEAVRLVSQYQGVDLGTAAELLQRVQDPQGLLSFVQEASEYLAEQGLAEFDDPAAGATTDDQNNLSQALDALASSDPEMAPLAEAVKAMQARLDSFEQGTSQRLQAEREEQAVLQAYGEIQRQENIIRTDNPQYTDQDVDAIYELASYYDGDLLQAQQSYEGQFARRLAAYLARKEAAPTPAVPTGLPQAVQQPELGYDPLDPKQAHEAALATLRLIESQSD